MDVKKNIKWISWSSLFLAFSIISLSAYGQNNRLFHKKPVSSYSLVPENQQISPMPLHERVKRNMVPEKGLASIIPGGGHNDMLMSGNGKMDVQVYGDPLSEQIVFRHERLVIPWKLPFEAPDIAHVLPEVRSLMLQDQYKRALELSFEAATEAGMPPGTQNHDDIPAFSMNIEKPANGPVKNYLRTVNFENGEIKVHWEDQKGQWERRAFVSRPDDAIVQLLTAPQGESLSTRIKLNTFQPEPAPLTPYGNTDSTSITYERDYNKQRLVLEGHFSPQEMNVGYAGVVRVIPDGGEVSVDDDILVVEGVKSLMLLTKIEWFQNIDEKKVNKVINELETITRDYNELLARNEKAQALIFNRASLNFDRTPQENAMAGEELLADQRTRIGYNTTLLSKLFDMSRYWLMLEGGGIGSFPPIYGHLNVNVNLQVSGGAMANLPEAMDSFYSWIEGSLPDAKKNAENIFGARGALFSVHPDQQQGVLYHWDYNWPHHYWISAGGWAYNQFWEHYLVTGDKEFLRNRIMPGLKELALFYEDYLTETDSTGNYIFVPSYSPENWPSEIYDGRPYKNGRSNDVQAVINATMDIMICREVLTHLITGSKILGMEAENIPKWKNMLEKMPNYLLDQDGALKEWAWPTLSERQDHRHSSHLHGVAWSDEITPDKTPGLAKAAWLANRKRAQGDASGHGLSQRALAAAKLKDSYLVNFELKQLIEQGYFGPALTSSHNPYTGFMPDSQGSILTIMMEMLVYSRPGVIGLLPALPHTLEKGNIKGINLRTFATVDKMAWNMKEKTVDLTITSLREQDITLMVGYGIESISASDGVLVEHPEKGEENCTLQLPKDKSIKIHVNLGDSNPSDWIRKVSSP
ncbi:glycoside hydrolase N-terminal domain-containing protein [Aliifodinibius sp. S!AR15-10]|uniref:glycosyl hydrolase family 95 catalytic domain-containing protein n=1 Tax=Aliifodinibius sp. S!AR15-10 TaxID=2950437 RepID=UPI00285E3197|nr:glycoside hydrolase N-terminal domain-containing protein [Aliifodinibius sp. S!AR15-10]MDR8393800.1 glycoside hydrolase N-terminal domain-containing protein [Aliifodinibius sp. S!AR15-10]